MKNTVSLIILLVSSSLLYGQVIIGSGKTAPTTSSVSLEFGTEQKGLVLPWVTGKDDVVTAGVVDGTLVFDAYDHKVYLRAANVWEDLTVETNGAADLTLQNGAAEKADAKVSIGAPTPTPGILVLEESNKGMVLPLVTSYKNISSPAAGMIVYDTTEDLFCVFNGTQWSFWRGT